MDFKELLHGSNISDQGIYYLGRKTLIDMGAALSKQL
jgi:hypothetical protein